VDCFHNYIRRKDSNFATLVDYADKLGNGAVFKRLGFLSERERVDHLVESCTARLTSGNAKLDSGVACPRLITRWRLLVPDSWTGQ
jgi:predicted transcriptional regulator of viral defense system